ncbi:TetR/AcrR family transcriptional regulator [Gulosibacter faecalis]|jgi:AcrR family transcriptional regulator|uniref:TetR/AcrR family transcriptional regulator n=1 Tax=Gulosibacter faecalis TaxID=272240 RepID=A0ABW5V403_9MICO|nr:TetR/AcrR family transcriptional regulator [Gulosibacter faecalis]
MAGNRRPAGRPRTRILGREVITEAARKIIATNGVQAFTMTQLAARLNVTPSAVYNHADSKLEILRWIEDSIMGEIDVTPFDEKPWREALKLWARSYRDTMAKHSELITAIATTEVLESPQTVAMYERVTQALVEAGWPLESIVPLITALESFIYGNAINEHAPEDVYAVGELARYAPTFSKAVEAQPERSQHAINDELFDIGFEAIVTWTQEHFAKGTGAQK